ncbi:APC family permease [Pseudomonas sp. LP23]|uniref:APC family permease n=1 Tax=Pseudomonas sp. LP23 TaxID=3029195 RepID=UPI0030BDB7D6
METQNKMAGLQGSLGVMGVVLMVLAQAAPLTVMAGTGPLMIGLGNGIGVPMTSVVVGCALLLFAFGFVAMSKYIEGSGAFYAYILKGMGPVTGIGGAAVAVVSYTLVLLALEVFLSILVKDAVERWVDVNLHWSIYTSAIILVIGVLGYRNIEASAKVLGVALVAEIAIIIVADIVVVWQHGLAGLDPTPLLPSSFMSGNPGIGILFTVLCFVGFEATVVYREEVKDPNRTIPLATYYSIIIIVVLYCVSFYLTIIGIGVDDVVKQALSNTEYMYIDFVGHYMGKVAQDIANVLVITSLFSAALANHNVIARYKYVLGRSSVINPRFSDVHHVHGSPHRASFTQTLTALALVVGSVVFNLDPIKEVYTWGSAAGTLGYMLIITLTALSVILFFRKDSRAVPVWNSKIAPYLSLICLVGFLYLALVNISALTGSQGWNFVNISIVAVVVGTFVIGSTRGLYLKCLSPLRLVQVCERV